MRALEEDLSTVEEEIAELRLQLSKLPVRNWTFDEHMSWRTTIRQLQALLDEKSLILKPSGLPALLRHFGHELARWQGYEQPCAHL